MKRIVFTFFGIICIYSIFITACKKDDNNFTESTSTFEDLGLGAETYLNGSDKKGQLEKQDIFGTICNVYKNDIKSGNCLFYNEFNETYSSWSGFAVSTITDNITAGFGNQYSSFAGKGANSSSAYCVTYGQFNSIKFNTKTPVEVDGFYLTNATYPALSMKNGDDFSKKFGGIDGNDPDWFKLKIKGIDNIGKITDSVEVYLADYQSADNSKDFILNDWKYVNLSKLGKVSEIRLELSSSDNSDWGMNTPAYFCLDNIKIRIY